MATQQYKNTQGVVISVELVEDEASEYHGLYRVIDKDGTVGHISEEQLKDNFTLVPAQPVNTRG